MMKRPLALILLALAATTVLTGCASPDSSSTPPKPAAAKTTPSKPKLSREDRVARGIAREFNREIKPYVPAAREVRSFDKHLDAWDASLAVHLRKPASHYYDSEAREIGVMVLGVGYRRGLCKVDVVGSDGIRIREHESNGRGCIEH